MATENFKARGILNYPEFVTPKKWDVSSNSFIADLEAGSYGTGLIVTDEVASALTDKTMELTEEFKNSKEYKDYLKKGIKEVVVSTSFINTLEDGRTEVRFKRAVYNSKGKKAEIEFKDITRKDLSTTTVEKIGSGTEAIIVYLMGTWHRENRDKDGSKYISFGVSLYLMGVVVLKLVNKPSAILDSITDEDLADGDFVEVEEFDAIPF